MRGGDDDDAVRREVEGGDRLRRGEIRAVAADEVHVGPPPPAHGDRQPQLPVRADDEGRRNERLQKTVAERETMIGELDASAQLLQSILDTVDVGIVVVDADGHDILMNTRQRRIHALATPPGNDDPGEAELLLRYPGTSLPIPADERPVRRAVLQESFSNYLVATGPPGEDGAAEQLLVIVGDLLQDSVSRSGKEKLVLRPGWLSEIAEHSVESFALRAEEAGIALISDLQPTPEMSVDTARMQQAVDNLLSNAVKYARRGGTVTVATGMIEGQAELRVTDTGIGMTAQEQTNLFTDFYRTETARNSDIPGHGIGLSLTRRIVVSHNGQISVRSQPGEGSTFRIRFAVE